MALFQGEGGPAMERVRSRYEAFRTGPSHPLVYHDVSACRNAASHLGGLRKDRRTAPKPARFAHNLVAGSRTGPNW